MTTLFVYDRRFISVLFPSYRVIPPDLFMVDGSVLVDLPNTKIPQLPFMPDKAIFLLPVLTSSCTLRLDSRQALLEYLQSVKGIKATKSLLAKVVKLSDQDFFDLVKVSVSLRRWDESFFQESVKVYDLFSALMESRQKCLVELFKLSSQYSYPEIWSSVITFLRRIDLYEDQKDSLSEFYRNLIFKARKVFPNYKRKLVALLILKEVSDVHIVNAILDLREVGV